MDFKLLIDGRLVVGATSEPVINPATEQPIAVCPRASVAQLDAAVAAAQAAFMAWSATPLDVRRKVLRAIADRIEAHADELARLLTLEQGKPLANAGGEVRFAAQAFRKHADYEVPIEVMTNGAGHRVEVHRRPLGVVALIMPWNYPLALLAFKLPFALLTGNAVIIKPAPTTPLATLRLGELLRDLVPAGVLNVIADNNDLGETLTQHPDIRKVSFTGSAVTGRKVMASAAGTLKRVSLELGGNDAAIVLDDADVKAIAPRLFGAAFSNSGQVCIAVKRVYAHSSIYDALCDELARLADEAIVGDGLQQGTQIGPVQNAAQFEKAKSFIESARREGKIIAGCDTADGEGYFIRPTIVRDIEDGAMLVDQEQFAPILPVIKFDDVEDAVRRTNNSDYGLGGSVWSADREKAYAVARRIDSGMVWVNDHLDFAPHIPFGGAKQSGIGMELSVDGMLEFSQTAVINIAKEPVA